MENIKITLEYDGTNFHGWQYQPGLRTVQGELQQALQTIFKARINVIGAGRTDAGVHARGQVANFLIPRPMPVSTILAALNGNLPREIRIIEAETVAQNFNARFDAIKRHYRYTIVRREIALNRHYAWCYKSPLDVDQIKTASAFLLGRHDFKAFCHANKELNHYYCTIEELRWEQKDHFFILNVIANRFLHNMVRIIVGTLINVGRGYTRVEQIPHILESRDRRNAGPTVPAKGLCLEKIYY